MYDVGKILKVGGSLVYAGQPGNDGAYVIDISKGVGSPVTVTKQAPMPSPRGFANSVVLPSGEVVILGGMNILLSYQDVRNVMMPDLWSPTTGKFRRLAPMKVPRGYHSIALLLPDARVLAAGGGACGGCAGDHPDIEILSPPYLFAEDGKPASRPVITGAPAAAARGATIAVTTERPAASFALVRLNSVSHSTDNDQRRVPLTPASSSGTSYQLRLPTDSGVLLPGPWMLFAMDEKGVPSVARVVRIQ
ncbi:galactose oxidase-like domain-containing protein [Methylobacterium oxalidis]|uniref:Uncharacterized protein n=1 Tax=Methylobacterium oxalidis TaxID=944322 RepID=A0A512J8U2_9HYPH|nr:galactose oxidase-like domain-containing protein [Methylobacterium oxalidis]GEP06380.1 hypothetical protein MOX02_44180 [Methylobacterium oxalidis]GJE29869.1 hypothetical protein LDDCCGHA_0032 [Methylobacterium oxalidis]GLS62427.1 hypothetical protein GCM10007888_08080 [Methylobacterium oxalidis]